MRVDPEHQGEPEVAERMALMELSAKTAAAGDLVPWCDIYRLEMKCQIVHDSIHSRAGWTQEYLLFANGAQVGYGSVAVAGPWQGKPTVYEFYVLPHHRLHAFDLFHTLLTASGAVMITVQTNDPLMTVMLHTFAHDVTSEAILFHDKLTTALSPADGTFRRATPAEAPDVPQDQLKWYGVVEVAGEAAATGGILFHYNRPYGDIYMDVAQSFRRRGLGSFLVQELKRVCYEGGNVPAARCGVGNIASRRTLQKAGFVPCGNILNGSVSP
jgi:GNAT superfamily N-acetyltransferase